MPIKDPTQRAAYDRERTAKRYAQRRHSPEFRERQREYAREYRAKNRDSVLAKQRANVRSLRGRFKQAACIAKRRKLSFTILETDYASLIQQPCSYCGGVLNETGTGLDRIDNSRGYEPSNVVPACATCNSTRANTFTVDEMKVIGAAIASVLAKRAGRAA